jgi:hypothetical protein
MLLNFHSLLKSLIYDKSKCTLIMHIILLFWNKEAVSFLGIHKWKPDIFIGFSPALHLHVQCTFLNYTNLLINATTKNLETFQKNLHCKASSGSNHFQEVLSHWEKLCRNYRAGLSQPDEWMKEIIIKWRLV